MQVNYSLNVHCLDSCFSVQEMLASSLSPSDQPARWSNQAPTDRNTSPAIAALRRHQISGHKRESDPPRGQKVPPTDTQINPAHFRKTAQKLSLQGCVLPCMGECSVLRLQRNLLVVLVPQLGKVRQPSKLRTKHQPIQIITYVVHRMNLGSPVCKCQIIQLRLRSDMHCICNPSAAVKFISAANFIAFIFLLGLTHDNIF